MNYFPNNYNQSGYVNPYAQTYNNQQSQLHQMQQPQFQQQQSLQNQMQQQNINQEILKGKRVSTLEEAKASTIEFDGSTFYFPSVDSKSIYTKQVGLDGNVAVLEYKLVANVTDKKEEAQQSNVDYVGIIEKQNTIIEGLNNRLSQLEGKTESLFKELGGK